MNIKSKFRLKAFKGLFSLICLCVVSLALCNCAGQGSHVQKRSMWMQPNGKLKVLSTIAMIDDLVTRVGGVHIDAYTLIQGDLDPHSYQLVKGDDETLAFADIIFSNGLGLEHGPSLQTFLQKSQKSIALGDRLRKADPQVILKQNGQIDPHIWMDVSLWTKMVPFIVENLAQKDPAHAADYQENGQRLIEEMLQQHAEIKNMLQAIPESHRYLVTSHDAFNYFARSYLAEPTEIKTGNWQKRVAAPEGLAPESQISVSDIQKIINHLRQYNIHVLFTESNVSKDSIRKILNAGSEVGLNVQIACTPLYSDAMGAPGSAADSYAKMMMHNAKIITHYLGHDASQGVYCE